MTLLGVLWKYGTISLFRHLEPFVELHMSQGVYLGSMTVIARLFSGIRVYLFGFWAPINARKVHIFPQGHCRA